MYFRCSLDQRMYNNGGWGWSSSNDFSCSFNISAAGISYIFGNGRFIWSISHSIEVKDKRRWFNWRSPIALHSIHSNKSPEFLGSSLESSLSSKSHVTEELKIKEDSSIEKAKRPAGQYSFKTDVWIWIFFYGLWPKLWQTMFRPVLRC